MIEKLPEIGEAGRNRRVFVFRLPLVERNIDGLVILDLLRELPWSIVFARSTSADSVNAADGRLRNILPNL